MVINNYCKVLRDIRLWDGEGDKWIQRLKFETEEK